MEIDVEHYNHLLLESLDRKISRSLNLQPLIASILNIFIFNSLIKRIFLITNNLFSTLNLNPIKI